MVRDMFAPWNAGSYAILICDRYQLRRLTLLAITAVTLVVAGCGGPEDGPPRFEIAGTVTHKGQPVPQGFIQFQPDGSKGNSGPAGSATIVDGKFDTAISGQGTIGGPHHVLISGFDGQADLENELPFGKQLFSDHKSEIDLPKQSHQFDFKVD